jgi:hypothetical protein
MESHRFSSLKNAFSLIDSLQKPHIKATFVGLLGLHPFTGYFRPSGDKITIFIKIQFFVTIG